MTDKNISDVIERYLKEIISKDQHVQIKRSEIAGLFDVVPSQINYVIKTRFSAKNGYVVESKRGGGGYIRIKKIHLLDNVDIIDTLIEASGELLSYRGAQMIAQTLYNNDLVTQKEAELILAAVSKQALLTGDSELTDKLRAQIMISILDRLKYKY